jgi:hypothetical protein
MICHVLHELCKCSEDCKNIRHYYTAEAETEEDRRKEDEEIDI